MAIKETQQDNILYHKSVLRRQLFSIFFVSLIVGVGLDLLHYSWMNYPWSKQIVIIGFTISVPTAVLALILFAIIIKPSKKGTCICLCLFSLPVSVVTMYYTYRTAIKRYNLGSETGMAIVFGVIPAIIIGLLFALLIYFSYKTNLKIGNAKA